MTSDARHNTLLGVGIIFGTGLLIGFLTTLINSKTGEAAGALGSVLGGVTGAVGAALAVALTLSGERAEERRQKQEKEIRQINAVIAGIGFNIEILLHIVTQNILPHYTQSHIAYKALQGTKGDVDRMTEFANSLHTYHALIMTCPELYFIEFDFWRELLFIVERDANVLKQSGWLVAGAHQIKNLTLQRNRNIEFDLHLRNQQGGKLNYYALESMLQRHVTIANAECITAGKLFYVLRDMAKKLERINDQAQGQKLILPPGLDDAMKELKQILDLINPGYATLSGLDGAAHGTTPDFRRKTGDLHVAEIKKNAAKSPH